MGIMSKKALWIVSFFINYLLFSIIAHKVDIYVQTTYEHAVFSRIMQAVFYLILGVLFDKALTNIELDGRKRIFLIMAICCLMLWIIPFVFNIFILNQLSGSMMIFFAILFRKWILTTEKNH